MRRFLCKAFLGALLSFVGCSGGRNDPTPEARAVEVLRAHVGRDLDELSTDESRFVGEAVERFEPNRSRGTIFGPTPRYIWEYCRGGELPHFLVCEVGRYTPSPFSPRIRLLLFDSLGRLRVQSEFTAGMRRGLQAARVAAIEGGEYPLVIFEWTVWGSLTDRDYYARIDHRFDLIRTEDSEGRAIRNCYFLKHGGRGPQLPVQTAEQWEADLHSPERARVLRALTWLSGHHALPPQAGEAVSDQWEDEAQAALG